MKLTSKLFKLARLSADISAVTSLSITRILRRIWNKFLGRKVISKMYWKRRGKG